MQPLASKVFGSCLFGTALLGTTPAEFFAVGSFMFWSLVAVELILLFIFSEYENGIGATLSLVAFGAALQWLGGVNVIGYLISHPVQIVAAVAAYYGLGVCWGVVKWRHFVFARQAEHDDMFADFLRAKGLSEDTTVLPVEFRKMWIDRVERTKDHRGRSIADVPLVRHNKARVLRWMGLWPFSFAMYLFKDMVQHAFYSIYLYIGSWLQTIADNIWSKKAHVKDNLTLPPNEQIPQGRQD